ncbi:rhodanese-like domain-containing protein [Anaerobacillus sp. CMMVII]|uniref:rhodanese-like domain-containing protein n=1 Tax=Anaerobacillus sp. CMMVII TaxID=2755588 RepID=UPI0021B78F80|nr:rhodanese-like domain-containing protein [Anaerobacillus sp. CMMVII]MCT8137872.1 rhodanese-like domain-containing protein [Anaerobacillus sp. CMMVII]
MAFIQDGVKQIEQEELKEVLKTGSEKVVVIDVREREEYNASHIPGIPLIPMSNFPNVINDLRTDKEYIIVCRSGNRSQHVALFLKEHGITAHNFYGGMLSWGDEVQTGLENVITDISQLYK